MLLILHFITTITKLDNLAFYFLNVSFYQLNYFWFVHSECWNLNKKDKWGILKHYISIKLKTDFSKPNSGFFKNNYKKAYFSIIIMVFSFLDIA